MLGCDPNTWAPNSADDTNYQACYYVPKDFETPVRSGRGQIAVGSNNNPATWGPVEVNFDKNAAKHGQTIQVVNRQYFHVTIDMDTYNNVLEWSLDALPEDSPIVKIDDYSDTEHNVYGWIFQAEGCMDIELLKFTGIGAPIEGWSTVNRHLSVTVIVGQDPSVPKVQKDKKRGLKSKDNSKPKDNSEYNTKCCNHELKLCVWPCPL